MNIITEPNIGDKLYPLDNSYLVNLSNPTKNVYLAGTHKLPALKVKVISKAEDYQIETYKGPAIHKFIHVEYEGARFRILSKFKDYDDSSRFSQRLVF